MWEILLESWYITHYVSFELLLLLLLPFPPDEQFSRWSIARFPNEQKLKTLLALERTEGKVVQFHRLFFALLLSLSLFTYFLFHRLYLSTSLLASVSVFYLNRVSSSFFIFMFNSVFSSSLLTICRRWWSFDTPYTIIWNLDWVRAHTYKAQFVNFSKHGENINSSNNSNDMIMY